MADTLRSLAGSRFRASDVVSALHKPLTPEERVLDRYVFLPHARTGIAAALDTPFSWSLPVRATVNMRVPVIDDRGGIDAEMTVHVYGPADVTEIDRRQVIRAFPKADAVDAEVDDLAHVEFDRPDLPWLFTPAGPDSAGHLVPWITLVVAERRHVEWGEWRGSVRVARIRRNQLQPLGDAWAWAHAQVMGAKGAAAETEPTLERRLSESNAAHNLSRLVCPRRLDDRTAYVACVVPTFLAGAQVAMGLTPVDTLAPSWGTAENFAGGDPLDMIALPVFFSWEFGTAEEGNFESLARKLRPTVAPPGVGRRRVDATHPWSGVALDADDPGAEIVVNCPIVSPQLPGSEPAAQWPPEAAQRWSAAVTDELLDKLNRADAQAHEQNPGPPLVGPPLYGGLHARQPRIETQAPADAAQPQWFRDLNIDPRHRIVAGLGTRVVQAEQEDLMLAAWNQVIGVEAANRALRLAQLAKQVGASIHRRHLSRLRDGGVVSVTERVHAKVLDVAQRTVWASIDASSLPQSVTTGAFRRLTRPRGRIVRAAVAAAAQRRHSVDMLTVREDRLTTDWVRAYQAPDGVRGIGAIASARITDALAARIAPGATSAALLQRWNEALPRPAPTDVLTPQVLDRMQVPRVVDLGGDFASSVMRQLLRTAPTDREIEASMQVAVTAASHAMLIRTLAATAEGVREYAVARGDVRRLRLDVAGTTEDRTHVRVTREAVLAFSSRLMELAQRQQVELPLDEFERTSERLREMGARSMRLDGGQVVAAMSAIAIKAVVDDPFAEAARGRISAPALRLVQKLDPKITVPARIKGRFTSGSGRMPSWMPPGWFDDLRIEPVMAHPRFRYPMYEPLHRYDREWMVPGLGLIQRPDMATLLVTNNRFIEAYVVGLNHEMARELLWREYPTDQRGTYFSSFWTGNDELVADMHMPPWRHGALGSHVDPALDGQLVFLVRGDLIRRYPGVVAHAAGEASSDRGIPVFEAGSPVKTLFHIHLPPNVLLVGFALTRARITTPGEKWWFTLSENPTEPRFGLDPSRDGAISRDNLVWTDFGVDAPGKFLDATRHTNLAFDGATWGASSAANAYLLFQLPARAAFQATKMVAGAVS
jgi:hypothetical protein